MFGYERNGPSRVKSEHFGGMQALDASPDLQADTLALLLPFLKEYGIVDLDCATNKLT